MKTSFFLLSLLGISLNSWAQIEKGSLLMEGGLNLSGNWNSDYYSGAFNEGFGISFGTNDYYSIDNFTQQEKLYLSKKRMNYSLAPRAGYFLCSNFVVGTDFRYQVKTVKYTPDNFPRERTSLYGFFARKYFGKRRITPFLEGEIGSGSSKSKSGDNLSPGGGYYYAIERRNLFYLAGAVGTSYSINSNFNINLLAKVQHTREKPIGVQFGSFGGSKVLDFDSALIVSFSYLVNKKTKPTSE